MSRIKFELGGVNLFDETDWNTMSEFVVDNLPKFELAFKPEIENLKTNRMVFVR